MSIREQTKTKHKWENRVRDWLIMPHGTLPTSKDYKRRIITKEELSKHGLQDSPMEQGADLPPPTQSSSSSQPAALWMAVDGVVYDVTRFVPFHPGGVKLMHQYSGIDATIGYHKHHTLAVDLGGLLKGYTVGVLEGSDLALEAAAVVGGPPSYESALAKSAHKNSHSSLNSEDISNIAKKSQLFEGVSDQALLEAVAHQVQRGTTPPSEGFSTNASSLGGCEARTSSITSGEERGPAGAIGVSPEKEAEDEALLAIYDVLDKDGTGKVPLIAVAEFLVNIEACPGIMEAEEMVGKLAEAEAVQQGYLTRPQYLKLAEQL